MARIACAAILALAALASPAEAAFDSCTFSGGVVTATFLNNTAGTLSVGPGGAIRADGVACQSATVNNTDTITVDGDADYEVVTIDLGGGPFAPGATAAGEGSSPEIEFQLNLEANFLLGGGPDLVVNGSSGADRLDAGRINPGTGTVVNLNGNEAANVDPDVDFDQALQDVELNGLGGNDQLGGGGGAGTGGPASSLGTVLRGGLGDDDFISNGQDAHGGPGDDEFTSFTSFFPRVWYSGAAGPITVVFGDGTGGNWGGTAPGQDGDGGTDTFHSKSEVHGTPFADVVTAGSTGDFFEGIGGDDTFTGGPGGDVVFGGAGEDDIDGNSGPDLLDGGADADVLDGGPEDDTLAGGPGDDEIVAGTGDDVIEEFDIPSMGANGADDLSGGDGTDTLSFAFIGFTSTLTGRSAPLVVDLDGVADDGEAGEGDNAMPDIENVIGGLGGDTFTGTAGPNVLSGFDGGDTLRGGDGDDELYGVIDPDAGLPDFTRDFLTDEGDTADGGGGADTIDTEEGDDTLEVRDGVADTVKCGAGNDGGRRDALDVLDADCENIALPVELPPDEPIVPPVEPPVTPPVTTPPVVTPPVTLPPPPTVAALLSLPSSRRCASRRKFTVRVRREIRGTVKAVTIFVNGKRVKRVTGTRIGLPIDLRGLPKGTIRVRLRVELNDGRVATDTRRYRTCATKKRRGQFGRRRRG